MRKVLLFLLVFGVGFLLLWLFRDKPSESQTGKGSQASKLGPFTEFPKPSTTPSPTSADQQHGPAGVLGGRLDIKQYRDMPGGAKLEIDFHASDTEPISGFTYDVHDIVVHQFNPVTGHKRADLVSPLSRVTFLIDKNGTPSLSRTEPTHLSNVDLTLFEGAPIVPIYVKKLAGLDWDFARRRYRSDDHVDITGAGLDAQGTGLLVEMAQESFVLPRDGLIHLVIPQDARAKAVSSTPAEATLRALGSGPIFMSKLELEGEQFVEVTAAESAELVVSGDEPFTLDADTIHLIGRVVTLARGVDQGFEIVTADAHGDVRGDSRGDKFRSQQADFTFGPRDRFLGASLDRDVVLLSAGDEFHARHAEFVFDTLGYLSTATLTGEPNGRIEVGRWLSATRPDLATERAEISGAGPLVIDRSKGIDLDLAGPGKVEMREADLVLTAEKRIWGDVTTDERTGNLHATGAAKLTHGTDVLASEKIDVHYALAPDGQGVVDAVTTTRTTVDGTSADGREFSLVAENGLRAQEKNKKLTVPLAHDVVLVVKDPDGMTTRAVTVRNFDWETRSFEAEGDVSFVNARGSGEADRAVSKGKADVELFGQPAKRAHDHFVLDPDDPRRKLEGETWAQTIHRVGDAIQAEGNATSYVVTRDGRLDLEGQHMNLRLAPIALPGASGPRPFHVEVRDQVHGHVNRVADEQRPEEDADIHSDVLTLDGSILQRTTKPDVNDVGAADLRAERNVHLVYAGVGDVEGFGDLLTLDREGKGRLSAGVGRRIRANGRIAGTQLPYSLDADWLEFDRQHVQSSQVRVKLELPPDASLPIDPEKDGASALRPAVVREMRAQSMYADKGDVRLDGAAHIDGLTGRGEDWWIDADSIRLQGDFSEGKSITLDRVSALVAQGNMKARLGASWTAEGDRLDGGHTTMRVEGRPAHISMLQAEWTSAWIQYDIEKMLLSTDKGQIRSQEGLPGPSWSVEYASMQPFDQPESNGSGAPGEHDETTILVLRSPHFRWGAEQLTSDWGLFWVNRNEWKKRGGRAISSSVQGEPLSLKTPDAEPRPAKPRGNRRQLDVISSLSDNPVLRVLSEAYVEGNVEMYTQGERFGRASAMYLDLIQTQGWMQDVDLSLDLDVVDLLQRGRLRSTNPNANPNAAQQRLRAKAEWMRITPGPTLEADKAEITSCDFDQPHYVIEVGNLHITPQKTGEDRRVAWGVSARHNTLRFESGLHIPLPPLVWETDKEGNPLIDRLVLGDSARFGRSFGASINGQLGSFGLGMGSLFAHTLGFPETDIRGNWRYSANILGSRGLLLGLGLSLRAKDKFTLDAQLDAIPDRRSDKGFVRVDKDDRSLLREWFHARARYTIDKGEWVDVALSRQSDAGVQSEFFEHDYVRYEQKDNYIHWRKAEDEIYTSASAKILLENRTDTAELPSAGIYRGRLPIGELWGEPLLYTASLDAAYLRRHDGDPRYYDPFEDGLGNRQVARIDTDHRLERPENLGVLGLRGTPYLEARATAWSQGIDTSDTPSRAALIAGYDLETTFWKRYSQGNIHTLTPSVGVHADVGRVEAGGEPVHFDPTENPIGGQFIDVGLRSRWWKPETREHFDADFRATYGESLPNGQRSGLEPVAVLAEWLTYFGSVPFAFTHDARYDTRDRETVYSSTGIGFEPQPGLGIELGYHTALDDNQLRLYEAASLGARWRWTQKWEVEFDESYSLIDNRGLGESILLRRFGHDFVTEIEIGYRAGEGSRFGIGIQPMISWRRSALGLLDRMLGLYH